jgi:hypothetical protein
MCCDGRGRNENSRNPLVVANLAWREFVVCLMESDRLRNNAAVGRGSGQVMLVTRCITFRLSQVNRKRMRWHSWTSLNTWVET